MIYRRLALALVLGAATLSACKKSDDATPSSLRAAIDYNTLTNTTAYPTTFKDRDGSSTVDLTEANQRLSMLDEMDTYMKLVTQTVPQTLDLQKLRDYYANTGAPFTGAGLNGNGLSLRQATAASYANPETIRDYIDSRLVALAWASQSIADSAQPLMAGRLGKYLLDSNGVELGQFIQKALMGAVQVDQISNVLLSAGALKAENGMVAQGKLYTALEHNWDLAYGTLTSQPAFGVTDEPFFGGYIQEMNPQAVRPLHLAFLKGRAAIVNRDTAVLRQQATYIRSQIERTVALAAVTYLGTEVKEADVNSATRMHALGEGLGFVYALRFCRSVYGVDDTWADQLMAALLSGPNTAWGVNDARLDAAVSAIKDKFQLQ